MRSYKGYLLDLDGTVYIGDELLPTAGPAVQQLKRSGARVVYLSNNPTRTRAQYAQKLTRMGLPTAVNEVMNSSYVMVRYLKKNFSGRRLFVIGEKPIQDELEEAGFELIKEARHADVVVASFDRTFDYSKLKTGFDALNRGARFVATNPDRYAPSPDGGEPDCAAVIAALEACTGREVEMVVGKPNPLIARYALDLMDLPAKNCLMVGDRVETDVALGKNAGMDSALVLTGATTREQLKNSPDQPDYVLEQLFELL